MLGREYLRCGTGAWDCLCHGSAGGERFHGCDRGGAYGRVCRARAGAFAGHLVKRNQLPDTRKRQFCGDQCIGYPRRINIVLPRNSWWMHYFMPEQSVILPCAMPPWRARLAAVRRTPTDFTDFSNGVMAASRIMARAVCILPHACSIVISPRSHSRCFIT